MENGTAINQYKIISGIGKGGMGEVFLAQDTKLNRKVALKILPSEFADDKDRMNRFVREAQSASALNHPNIITIHEIGESEGMHFIATEFIDGKTLNDHKKANPLNYRSALDIAIQVASALEEAHQAGIVHRDIKPDNVMVRSNGLVKILDFGIAKLSEPPGSIGEEDATAIQNPSTSPGMIIGTANYMSPEQAEGKPVDARTDIFSFGVLLYEMIAGQLPFEGENALVMVGSILNKEPKPLDSNVPAEVGNIVYKCLQKDRDERYQTIKDVLIDLKDIKQSLELQNLMERSVVPIELDNETQILNAATADEVSQSTYNQTPSGNSKTKLLVAGLLAVLLAIGGFFGYRYLESYNSGTINSIAVLPFQNKSDDADTDYLSDGLAESLIFRLTQIRDLKVSPASSVMRYKGKETDPAQIAKELGVDAVMTGRMVKRGDNLNITIELVDARNNRSLWGEQYERKMSELLATQREIAAEIANKLQLKLSGESQQKLVKRYTENNEAYQLYLQGRFHWAKRTGEETRKAIELYNQAIALDRNFALAYVGVADAYNSMGKDPHAAPKDCIPLAKEAAVQALKLDPALAEARAALADSAALYEWDWPLAEREFTKAFELDPNVAYIHLIRGTSLFAPTRRSDQMIAELKRALELEPLSLINNAVMVTGYLYARQNQAALQQARKTYDLDPDFRIAHHWLGLALIANGLYADAVKLGEQSLQKWPDNPELLFFVGQAYARSGRRNEAEAYIGKIKEVAERQYVRTYWLACIYAALGDKDKAFAELEQSFRDRDCFLPRANIDPNMDPLRDDPRFKNLMKRMGLPD